MSAEKNLSKNPVCTYCGKKRGLFEHLNKYGFCESCYETTKKAITNSIATLSELCSKLPDKTDILLSHTPESKKAILNTVESGFSLLQKLNEMKIRVPAFKSDLSGYELKLTTLKKSLISTPKSPSKQFVISEEKDGLRLLYHYDDVLLFIPEEMRIDSDGWEGGEPLRFELESTSKKTERAVAFYLGQQKIGYLFPGALQEMIFDFVKRQEVVISHLVFYSREAGDLKIFLGFYGKTRYQKLQERGESFKSYRLTHPVKFEGGYEYPPVGEEMNLEYDEDSEKYEVLWDCNKIGFLPKNATQAINNSDYKYETYIQSIEFDENDRPVIQVAVFF